jgi:hypothetical protein
MKKIVYTGFISLGLVLVLGFSLSSFTKNKSVKRKMPVANSIVVLELFTSQGCSSCPSADAVLAKYVLENNPHIIPLAFHVDYWNRLGWKDPFSQAIFTERQNSYAQTFRSDNIYTPQLIINGKYELVGSKASAIEKKIKDELVFAAAEEIKFDSIRYIGNRIKVNISTTNTKNANFLNIALVKKKEVTMIKNGENEGLKLANYNVVVDFMHLSAIEVKSKDIFIAFNKSYNPEDYFVVTYLQNNTSGKVLGGTKHDLPKRQPLKN